MKSPKEKASELQLQSLKLISSCSENSNKAIQPGSYLWRKLRRQLVISDHIAIYRANRAPRGDYQIPLKEDLIRGKT